MTKSDIPDGMVITGITFMDDGQWRNASFNNGQWYVSDGDGNNATRANLREAIVVVNMITGRYGSGVQCPASVDSVKVDSTCEEQR